MGRARSLDRTCPPQFDSLTVEILKRTPQGRAYLYEAAVPDAAAIAVRSIVRDFGESAVAQFVDEARADAKLLRRLKRLLRER